MDPVSQGWWSFGYTGIFLVVFIDQLGVPIPAFAALIGAGALIATGKLSWTICLIVSFVACLLADTIWYEVGRRNGRAVLYLLCKLSWKPDICVIKTKLTFNRGGGSTLIFGKFIPALGVLAPPMAGMTGIPLSRFLAYDAVGSALYVLAPLLVGAYLQHFYEAISMKAHALIPYLPWILGVLVVIVATWRFLYRRRYRRILAEGLKEAITPAELKSLLEQGAELTLLDVRDEVSATVKPHFLPQAQHLPLNLLKKAEGLRMGETMIIYCDCPEDHAAVEAVNVLKRKGAGKVRPLLGGLAGWVGAGYETIRREIKGESPAETLQTNTVHN